jgi:diguanylate cyclase (GGDEF)-like protein
VLLLPHTSTEMAHAVCVRIRQQLAQATRESTPGGAGVTLSVGIASLRNDSVNTSEGLLASADRALYQAKEAGRDRIVILGHARKPAPAPVA